MPEVFVEKIKEFPDGKRRIVFHDGLEIGVFHWQGQFYAYQNLCLHQGGPCCEGVIMHKVEEVLAPDKTWLGQKFNADEAHFVESGLAWIPFMMQRFDNEYMMRTSEAPALKRLPSDYMREMYFASQPLEITDMGLLKETFRVINAETQLVYSSDYPHWDFDLPSTIYDLPFLSEQAKRNILGGNAIRLFNLKLGAEKLARVA